MARLILSLDGQVLAEYNMTKERYTVGRLPDNDVRIDNAAVSGHHGLIINILNDSFLEDLNSTNGTYVNGKIIKKHALQGGDTITVGHHSLRFVDGEGDEPEDEFEKTMVIQPGRSTRHASGQPPIPWPVAAAPHPRPPRNRRRSRSGRKGRTLASGQAAGSRASSPVASSSSRRR
jgi:pSer/pThr/pTyr-binding forkhead associated (FHA) protein